MNIIVKPSTISGTLVAPASKSYAQRAIAAALLCQGRSTLLNMGLCNDTSAALAVAEALGAGIAIAQDRRTYHIEGGFLSNQPSELNIGESGLSTRLFAPIAACSTTPITINGHGSILTRPFRAIEQPLRELGARITTTDGHLPLTVCGPLQGAEITVDGSLSSQFITGLLVSLPICSGHTVLNVTNPRSLPYLDMTLEVLSAFGITVAKSEDYTRFEIAGGQRYRPTIYNIEGDWSGASCILVAGAIAGEVTVVNLNSHSLQADSAIICALLSAGAVVRWSGDSLTVGRGDSALRAFEFDATDCPDLFPALAALASHCCGRTTLVGTERLTHKESDRAASIASEFAKLGVQIDISQPNVMIVHGRADARTCIIDDQIDSHNDHRIAMATATAALTAERAITIQGAESVNKSYPDFWNDLQTISR